VKPFVATFELDDGQAISEQHAHEGVLTREEHVRVAQNAILEDEQHPQHEEWSVLHRDRYHDEWIMRNGASCIMIDITMDGS